MTDTEILHVRLGDIHPYPGNPRKNDDLHTVKWGGGNHG